MYAESILSPRFDRGEEKALVNFDVLMPSDEVDVIGKYGNCKSDAQISRVDYLYD